MKTISDIIINLLLTELNPPSYGELVNFINEEYKYNREDIFSAIRKLEKEGIVTFLRHEWARDIILECMILK